jgi:hypothetical protein
MKTVQAPIYGYYTNPFPISWKKKPVQKAYLCRLPAYTRTWLDAASCTSSNSQIPIFVRDLVRVSGGSLLTRFIVEHAIDHFPVFWTRASAIDDDIISFTQKGGWHKLDSVHAGSKSSYSPLWKRFDSLTEGLKVGVGDFTVCYEGGTDIFYNLIRAEIPKSLRL